MILHSKAGKNGHQRWLGYFDLVEGDRYTGGLVATMSGSGTV